MMSKLSEPALWTQVWQLITAAGEGSDHPYRTPVVGNVGKQNVARLRTLVLRHASASTSELTCHTDLRSVKAQQLAIHPKLSWLFWDPETQLQFTGSGPTRWEDRSEALSIFRALPKHGRKAYATDAPPASPLPSPQSGLPQDWSDRDLADTDYAADNFGVLTTRLDRAEVLHLDRNGSRRLTAIRAVDGEWQFSWVVP